MRARLRSFTLVLSSLTLMCSAPDDSPGGVGGAGTAPVVAGNTAAGAGGGSVLPSGGAAPAGAGAGGMSGLGGSTSAGAAGMVGGGAAGTGGGAPGPTPTKGCQAASPGEEPQTWLTRELNVTGLPSDQVAMFAARKYFVRLPVDYDHARPYPIVFYGPGCGATNVESTPMMNQIKNDAIHVFLLQKGNCFSTGYPSPEVHYFTQALDEIQSKYCTDEKRVFVSGYSSGAWLSNLLACAMGPRIRGIGTAAGGLRKATIDGYKCPAPAVGILYTGENDNENPADRVDDDGFQYGVIGARNRLIQTNGCNVDASETWSENAICKIWKQGCEESPVVYCVGPGDGHGKGDGNFNVSNKAFWDLWMSVP